jgi:DNA polymerase-4
MDAFYAAVEQLDDPSLRGKPVLIGPNSQRGVVLTASYEARPYGVGSAMPVAQARRRCPDAIMVQPRFERYQEISQQVMEVFADFSPAVEPLSLDEAFLDMSGTEHMFGSPHSIGRQIKEAVLQATQLNISVGVSGTKYVAKVASAHDKPNGLTVVPQDEAAAWLAPMPVERMWGVGKKTAARLHSLGLHTIGEIAALDPNDLAQRIGMVGSHFHQLANAQDPRGVSRGRGAKSIGSDRTLNTDVSSRRDIELHLRRASERVARRVRAKEYVAHGVRVRLKTSEFQMLTRQRRLSKPIDTAEAFMAVACSVLDEFDHPGPFRLVGMTAYDLDWRSQPQQSDLFTDHRSRDLETTIDGLIERFGSGVVVRAKDLGNAGTVSDMGVNLDFLDDQDGERVSKPKP